LTQIYKFYDFGATPWQNENLKFRKISNFGFCSKLDRRFLGFQPTFCPNPKRFSKSFSKNSYFWNYIFKKNIYVTLCSKNPNFEIFKARCLSQTERPLWFRTSILSFVIPSSIFFLELFFKKKFVHHSSKNKKCKILQILKFYFVKTLGRLFSFQKKCPFHNS
jgi:hypothetical protein